MLVRIWSDKYLLLHSYSEYPSPEMALGEDLPCSHPWIRLVRFAGSYFCGKPSERRMARRTATGASSKTNALRAAAWCSATFCI